MGDKFSKTGSTSNGTIIGQKKLVKVTFRECMSFKPALKRFSDEAIQAASRKMGIPVMSEDIKIREGTIPIHNKYMYIFRTLGKNEKTEDGISILWYAEIKGVSQVVKNKIESPDATKFVKKFLKNSGVSNQTQNDIMEKSYKELEFEKNLNNRRMYLRQKDCLPSLAKGNGKFNLCTKRSNDKEPSTASEKDYVELEIADGIQYYACIVNHYLSMSRISQIRADIDYLIKNNRIGELNSVYTPITNNTLLVDPDAKDKAIKSVILIDHLSEIDFLHSHFKIFRRVILQYILNTRFEDDTDILKQIVFATFVKAEVKDEGLKNEYIKCIKDGYSIYEEMYKEAKWINNVRTSILTFGQYFTIWMENVAGKERVYDFKTGVDGLNP